MSKSGSRASNPVLTAARNHFNNPHRHIGSQAAELRNPNGTSEITTTISQAVLTHSPVEMRPPALSRNSTIDDNEPSRASYDPPTPPSFEGDTNTIRKVSTIPAADRAIGHIEHYAHTTDFVALWGVLHFVTNEMASPLLPHFIGRVFSRTSSRGGHQFVQHYLDGMFPLERNAEGNFVGCNNSNEFMNSIVEKGEVGAEAEDLREGIDNSWALIEGRHDTGNTEVAVHGSFREGKLDGGKVRVKDLSRLWLYRNGKSPSETPRGLQTDADGTVRAGTL